MWHFTAILLSIRKPFLARDQLQVCMALIWWKRERGMQQPCHVKKDDFDATRLLSWQWFHPHCCVVVLM